MQTHHGSRVGLMSLSWLPGQVRRMPAGPVFLPSTTKRGFLALSLPAELMFGAGTDFTSPRSNAAPLRLKSYVCSAMS